MRLDILLEIILRVLISIHTSFKFLVKQVFIAIAACIDLGKKSSGYINHSWVNRNGLGGINNRWFGNKDTRK
jgi:hypothetical protein